ncbi:Asp23/Gls24 family envelope stress response protein [Vagococcus intermedius]|uniref:Asp23/Gls24 family envelope stress response protein n=1 Tax=Vagococcus intermedius TaxID=2991418 RepID=A0AAF0CVW4_9ENTE|nr:Asp23/Gls24 family envelope stress response protein [Vagococcus intermedius]WEG73841.1 Asp23/Gls24 family envelope stress response protein [Vagococcus intermedius]WEG75926.1 Asp23/Gls24 family envelope stress response protein [Vagococcus intermedius]
MTEETFVINNNQTTPGGEIVIAPEVIEVIIGIAASKVEGVYGMRGDLASNVNQLLGRTAHSKGVYLKNEEDGLRVDLYCYLNYGVAVPKVALDMQEKVKQQVLYMTDINLSEVNIHVVGVVPEKTENPKIDELFDVEEDE